MGYRLTDFSMFMKYLGITIVYYRFVGKSFHELVCHYFNICYLETPFIWVVFFVILPVNMLGNMRKIALVSMVGLVTTIMAIIFILINNA